MSTSPRTNFAAHYGTTAVIMATGLERLLAKSSLPASLPSRVQETAEKLLQKAHHSFYFEGFSVPQPRRYLESFCARQLVLDTYARAEEITYPSTLQGQEAIIKDLLVLTQTLRNFQSHSLPSQQRGRFQRLLRFYRTLTGISEDERTTVYGLQGKYTYSL